MARERRLTVVLVAALVAVVVVGLGAAFAIGRDQRDAGRPTTPGGSASTGATTATTGTTATTRSPSGTTRSTVATGSTAATNSSSRASTGAPGGVEVALSAEAQSSSHAAEVQNLLQRYFEAINAHDYQAWAQAVTPAQSAHWAEKDWRQAYSSTEDLNIYVSDINEGAPMSVRIQFVSHQDVDLAPSSLPVACINWDVIYRLEAVDGALRVGTSLRDPYLVACR